MPTFSVIVPVYKVEPYLDECIQSILNQTYKDFELILVDDGSPDKCPHICDSYAALDNRVKVIHKPNGGVTSARNEGIQIATGEYLAFVDGDDFIGETLLEKVFTVISEHHVEVVAFGYTEYRDGAYGKTIYNQLPVGKYNGEKLNEVYDDLLVGVNGRCLNMGAVNHYLWAKVVKKDFFWSIQQKIPKEIVKGEDAATVMLLLNESKQLYVAEIGEYFYRYVPSSASRTFKVGLFHNNRILCDFIKANCKKIPEENVNTYAMMSAYVVLMQAARSILSYKAYKKHIEQSFLPLFSDMLNMPLIPNIPFGFRLKCSAMRHHCFVFFWIFYHYLKK